MDVNGLGIKKAAPPVQTIQPDPPKEEPKATLQPAGLTIAAAMELRENLVEDVECYDNILEVAGNAELTDRVIRALTWQRDMHRQALDQINEVFNTVVLQL